MREYAPALMQCPLFTGVEYEKLFQQLDDTASLFREFRKKEYIMRSDRLYPFLSVILDGTVEIHRPLLNGRNLCIGLRSSGDLFGGATVFYNATSGCDIFARTKVRLMELPQEKVLRLSVLFPQIMQNMNNMYSRRILAYQQRLELMSYSSIKQKIAYYCVYILKMDETGIRPLPFSKAKWSEYMNVSRPSLLRELKDLSREGILTAENNSIRILDKAGLEDYLF